MAETIGNFEQAVLLSVLRLGGEAYSRAIVDEVASRMDRHVAVGAVHVTLVRLERKGMLKSVIGDGTPARAGRPRRYYTLARQGVRALRDARDTHSQMWRGIRAAALEDA